MKRRERQRETGRQRRTMEDWEDNRYRYKRQND